MKKAVSIITVIVLPVFVLLFVFQLAVFDLDYFEKKFIENNTMEITGLDLDQLMRVSDETLKYLNDERQDLILHEEVNGEEIQVFEENELNHMRDVKILFMNGFIIKNAAMFISILCLVYLVFKDGKLLWKTIRTGAILYLLLIGAVAVMAYVDFRSVFVVFHKLLFTNELWIMDPKEDIMIQMLPLDFFMGIGIRTAALYFGYIAISIVISTMMLRGYNEWDI
ncbi:integral membrane protein TIGR01906 [Dethiosulfatibacter aminovorans DSM 17477]|uniref:Integral membrane protein TIGR01906 n=1 Tax=Dethiosulfatibacter aminovorans DSM 17477 TaxID=1121476 RepID=A0A1M6H2I5_9FIRM|nr:TIGR01906 family membrane protein [Dethiosulfatibacter aminovorans]SHJ16401.1 integral membrane protein TIGR01906 [Dethiosulfatibacter aminovorans DSM 17477]